MAEIIWRRKIFNAIIFLLLVLVVIALFLWHFYFLSSHHQKKLSGSRYQLAYKVVDYTPALKFRYFFYDDTRTRFNIDLMICCNQSGHVLHAAKIDNNGIWQEKAFLAKKVKGDL